MVSVADRAREEDVVGRLALEEVVERAASQHVVIGRPENELDAVAGGVADHLHLAGMDILLLQALPGHRVERIGDDNARHAALCVVGGGGNPSVVIGCDALASGPNHCEQRNRHSQSSGFSRPSRSRHRRGNHASSVLRAISHEDGIASSGNGGGQVWHALAVSLIRAKAEEIEDGICSPVWLSSTEVKSNVQPAARRLLPIRV